MNSKISPLVSVVMSVYGGEDCLAESIDSVLGQSVENFEFIIVDDGSNSEAVNSILSDYKLIDTRIKILVKDNEGLTKALIDGCDRARGKYIARIDVGDFMCESRLKKQIAVFERYSDTSMVSSWTEMSAPDWEHMWINKGRQDQRSEISSLTSGAEFTGDVSHHGSMMFRKDRYIAAGGYRWQFYYGQDWDLWYRLSKLGRYRIISEVLYKARIFPSSISMTKKNPQEKIAKLSYAASKTSDQSAIKKILKRAAQIRPEGSTTRAGNTSNETSGNYFIGRVLLNNKDIACRKYLARAVKSKPLNFKFLVSYIRSFAIGA